MPTVIYSAFVLKINVKTRLTFEKSVTHFSQKMCEEVRTTKVARVTGTAWPSLKELNLYFNIMNVKLCLLLYAWSINILVYTWFSYLLFMFVVRYISGFLSSLVQYICGLVTRSSFWFSLFMSTGFHYVCPVQLGLFHLVYLWLSDGSGIFSI